jgi:hypothetical protein
MSKATNSPNKIKNNSKVRRSSMSRPLSSKKRRISLKGHPSKIESTNTIRKTDSKPFIKTQNGFRKKFLPKSITFTDKKIVKPINSPFLNEASSSPRNQTRRLKQLSSPVGIAHTKRDFDIPIKMSAFDRSDSISEPEEIIPFKTNSEIIDLQKTLKFKNVPSKFMINHPNIKNAEIKESKALTDSSE